MKPPVLSSVVDQDLCIGCGICAALCPDSTLIMQFNRYGEYNPVSIKECTTNCGICLKICPFANGNPDEDMIGQQWFGGVPEIHHRPETGFYLETYVGYSNSKNHREHGSSGGMATWLLESLLEEGVVDAVIAVKHNPDPEKLFKFAIFETPGEVRSSSGSAYYPVEFSKVVGHILSNPGKYAVIALPCFVKALRLSQLKNKKLRDRIIIILGLTCGQLKNKQYTTYLAALAGLEERPVRVNFRGKDPEQPANNYFFTCVDRHLKEKRIYQKEGVSRVWRYRWFTPNACNYCDDVFAECADVTFMDAWLPEYSCDSRGTNFLIIRSLDILYFINKRLHSKQIYLNDIDIFQIIQSQRGVFLYKKIFLAYRLHHGKRQKKLVPKKRVMAKNSLNPLNRLKMNIISEMQNKSKQLIPIKYYSKTDILNNVKNMYWSRVLFDFIRFLEFPLYKYFKLN
jgi:coenzyme F420-reducing hydrogenase beta subunit